MKLKVSPDDLQHLLLGTGVLNIPYYLIYNSKLAPYRPRTDRQHWQFKITRRVGVGLISVNSVYMQPNLSGTYYLKFKLFKREH